jgi:predicted secreted protein
MKKCSRERLVLMVAVGLAITLLTTQLSGCGSTTTTTQEPTSITSTSITSTSITSPPASTTTVHGTVIKIDESANGTTVHVQPGVRLELVLTGEPAAGYTWNLIPPRPEFLSTLPGPDITGGSDQPGSPSTYTFSFLVISVGEARLHANYVSSLGKTDRSFDATIKIESSEVTTTTQKPTITTHQPTTTTTKPRPTTTTQPNTLYIDERHDGQLVHLDTGWDLVLTLQGNPSTGFLWRIDQPVEDDVIKLAAEPVYQPFGPDPGEGGVYVWTFSVVAPGTTALELHYAGPGGEVTNNYFVGIVVDK